MQKRKFDELVSYFNKKVSEMEIETKYKMELLGMVTALGFAHEKEMSDLPETHDKRTETHGVCLDTISRQAAIDAICTEGTRLERNGTVAMAEIKQWCVDILEALPSATCCNLEKPERPQHSEGEAADCNLDCISRQDAIDALRTCYDTEAITYINGNEYIDYDQALDLINTMPSAQPDLGKYEYHYDHTDCIWYRPEARNRCPVTCAQYRDGWNDAMNYIFRDGKGYRPYRRGEQYEE